MDKNTKTFIITLAGAIVLFWLLKPKGSIISKSSTNKFSEPKVADSTKVKAKEDAVIGLQAMREAIDNNEPKKELDKLSSIIFQDYGVKIMFNKKAGLLRAMDKSGKVLAEEQKIDSNA